MRIKAALLCLILAAAAHAETFSISVKTYPAKGKSFTVASRDRIETNIVFKDTSGKETGKDDSESVQSEEYTQETLEVKETRLGKFKREYGKASVISGGKTRDLAFANKTVTFTVNDKGGCAHDLKADKLGDGEKRKLADADSDGLEMVAKLLPGKPVAAGDTWKIDGKQIAGVSRAFAVDPDKSKGVGKLVAVTKKGDKLFGTLHFQLELETKDSGDGKAQGTFELKVETPIDGSGTEAKITIRTSLKMEASVKEDGKELKASVTAKGEYTAEIGQEK